MPHRRPLAASMLIAAALTAAARAAGPAVYPLWPDEGFVPKASDVAAGRTYDADDKLNPRKNNPQAYDLSAVVHPSICVYLPAAAAGAPTGPVPAAVICPGGGYQFESVLYEGDEIAQKLAANGVAGVVLRYRLPGGHAPAAGELPVPQQDVLRALQLVRANAAEWKIDVKKVGVIGFSAGGHLAATAATLYDQADTLTGKAKSDAASKLSARPDFAVLVYPVITMDATNTHTGSRRNLVGTQPGPDAVERFSAEKHVTPQTPPLLIVHAADDKTVPVANAIMMASAAAQQHVPCELLLFASGGHGFGLGNPGTEAATWFDRMLQWMAVQGVLPATK